MALVPFKLPRIQSRLPIVDAAGRATDYFLRLLNIEVFQRIEKTTDQTNQNIADLQAAFAAIQAVNAVAQAAQQAANTAQETADAAGGGTAVSGFGAAIVEPQNLTWQQGPQVDLTGVAAGNLTISGTGPQQDDTLTASISITGEFRVVEIVGVVETTVFTGNYQYYVGSPGTVVNESAASVAAFSAARASTGAVSYRLDANRTDGGIFATPLDLSLYLFVRRA